MAADDQPRAEKADARQHTLNDPARRIGMQRLAEHAGDGGRAEADDAEGPDADALVTHRALPADGEPRCHSQHDAQDGLDGFWERMHVQPRCHDIRA